MDRVNRPNRIDAFFGTFFAAKTPAFVVYFGTVLLGLIAYLLLGVLWFLWKVWNICSWIAGKLYDQGCVARRAITAFKERRYVE